MLKPSEKVPDLSVKTLDGKTWNIRNQNAENFLMIVFYRGLHCPVCKVHLEKLQEEIEEFEDLGTEVICISADSEEDTKQTKEEWDIEDLQMGFEMDIEAGRNWGVYISSAIKKSEPERFFEPAVFLVKSDDLTLYFANIQSMQFGRPNFSELRRTVKFILRENYPPRGGA